MNFSDPSEHQPEELIQRLCSVSGLSREQAVRVAIEMTDYFDSTAEAFIVERHSELQRAGLSNNEIYRQLESEVTQRVFRSAPMSVRQIRRVIYG